MYKILIDTCVWIDLAKDPNQHPLLDVLQDIVRSGEISLLVPEIIVLEFNRNKERVIKEDAQSLSSTFKRVKQAMQKFGDSNHRDFVIEHLNNVNYKIPLLREAFSDAIESIQTLIHSSEQIAISDDVKIRATQRGIEKIAPFHRGKNSINDALILECFLQQVRSSKSKDEHFLFVTHNKTDFSSPLDERQPHPDFAEAFKDTNSEYETKLSEALNKVRPDLVTDAMITRELFCEIRNLSEILDVENELFETVWYTRHQLLKHQYSQDILSKSEQYAAEIEVRHGKKKLGPWTDLEWGMINGKLSAIRWLIGNDWDTLDS